MIVSVTGDRFLIPAGVAFIGVARDIIALEEGVGVAVLSIMLFVSEAVGEANPARRPTNLPGAVRR